MKNKQEDWYEREQLHFAAGNGDLEEVKALLADGYPINAFDDLSWTPLIHAAKKNHVNIVKYLIEAGADVNAHNDEEIGDTVLKHIVRENCSVEMVKILLDAGANPTIPGWMQLTALDEIYVRKKLNHDSKQKKQKSDIRREEVEEIYTLLYEAAKKLNPNWPRLSSFSLR